MKKYFEILKRLWNLGGYSKHPQRVELDEGLNRLCKGGVNAPPPVDAVPPPTPQPQKKRPLTEGKVRQGGRREPPEGSRPGTRPQAEPLIIGTAQPLPRIEPPREWRDPDIPSCTFEEIVDAVEQDPPKYGQPLEVAKEPDLEGLEKDVVVRIRLLREIFNRDKLDASQEVRDKLWEDLVVPNIALLAEFCTNIKISEEKE